MPSQVLKNDKKCKYEFILSDRKMVLKIMNKCLCRSAEHKRAMWRLGDVSEMSEEGSQGCLRAKFHMKSGPAAPAPTAVQFMCEGSTLSGVDFELMGAGYRVSLVKKRFVTGKI